MPKYEFEVGNDEGTKKAVIQFKDTLSMEEWESLRTQILSMLGGNYMDWEFDIRELTHCNSITLGMWVTLNAVIANKGGKLALLTRAESNPTRLLSLTKLDGILEVKQAA